MENENSVNIQLAKAAIDNSEYVQAFKILRPLAEKGNGEAQAKVGLLYQLGLGTERNIEKAFELLTTAAEKGYGEAAHNLGTLYLTCEPDMPRDADKSKYWYNKAQELGFIVATHDWYKK